jgi:hypothetical protein
MPTDKTGTYHHCIALVGVCSHCGEAVRLVLTKQEAKIIWQGFKLPPEKRNQWVEKQFEKLKKRGVIT